MNFKGSSRYHLANKIISIKEGIFYVADNFIVGEINEGAHFNWDIAEKVIEQVYEHYGSRDINISYISNRVNNYSIAPLDWFKFFVNKHKLKSINIVSYTPSSLAFFFLEKFFIKTTLRKFENLEEAIDSIVSSKKMVFYNFKNLTIKILLQRRHSRPYLYLTRQGSGIHF